MRDHDELERRLHKLTDPKQYASNVDVFLAPIPAATTECFAELHKEES